ncbi:MAG TPA: cytochrome c [Candidatus Saccharimonadales bacterium]|nr:cytochrome c [Candidatus Saccharimonadales bacterium]
MIRILRLVGVLLLVGCVLAVAGCGKKAETGATTGTEAAGSAAAPAGTAAAPAAINYADLDKGPRAADTPVDAALAAKGKVLFGDATNPGKTCYTCHAFDKKIIGPPLSPVAKQRTAAWMMAQMMHPDLMTQNDPASKQLLAEYKVQMIVPGGVTEDEAKALVEYVKSGGK